jgi:hypothetical protein
MVITRLVGGLGNQMFQYAFGRKMALKNNDILKIDTSALGKEKKVKGGFVREYQLNVFNIEENFATSEESEKLRNPYGIFSKILRKFRTKILKENYVDFVPSLLNKKGNFLLDGFFQCEKYFKDIRETLIKDFTFKNGVLSNKVKEFEQSLNNKENSVFLHVRRTDYLVFKGNQKYWGICEPEYYYQAIEHISKQVGDINLFIFSDDIKWVKENLKFNFPATYVSEMNFKDHEEMYLMSKCDHGIIANSSFSWWGAWLNTNSKRIIVAPTTWVKPEVKGHTDIIPDSWIKI